jgi:hypothetical protein
VGVADEHVGIEMWFQIRHLVEVAFMDEVANHTVRHPRWPPGQAQSATSRGFLANSTPNLPMPGAAAVTRVTLAVGQILRRERSTEPQLTFC